MSLKRTYSFASFSSSSTTKRARRDSMSPSSSPSASSREGEGASSPPNWQHSNRQLQDRLVQASIEHGHKLISLSAEKEIERLMAENEMLKQRDERFRQLLKKHTGKEWEDCGEEDDEGAGKGGDGDDGEAEMELVEDALGVEEAYLEESGYESESESEEEETPRKLILMKGYGGRLCVF
ncbi:hypothetical protein BCR34DRAFT_600371 [Clohesyomyces aquaticus]|uniref:Uncharacterized protein n=1 Tax=Clohesyomyces aquaticus TaxID=1231657 RepID=A0A1Y1ZRN2_9PLEO|nr:hypothetical protein BCR34DRAFT_600371 [Clohesyomyces aquaticus]